MLQRLFFIKVSLLVIVSIEPSGTTPRLCSNGLQSNSLKKRRRKNYIVYLFLDLEGKRHEVKEKMWRRIHKNLGKDDHNAKIICLLLHGLHGPTGQRYPLPLYPMLNVIRNERLKHLFLAFRWFSSYHGSHLDTYEYFHKVIGTFLGKQYYWTVGLNPKNEAAKRNSAISYLIIYICAFPTVKYRNMFHLKGQLVLWPLVRYN